MNEEIDLYADVDKVHSSDFQEVHQTREPISKLVRRLVYYSFGKQVIIFQVSIYIGNLTWWTSDLDIEQHIRKNGITDLVEVSLQKTYQNFKVTRSNDYVSGGMTHSTYAISLSPLAKFYVLIYLK